MKGIVKFFVRWVVAYIVGAGVGVSIIIVAMTYFEDNEGLSIFICIVGLLAAFSCASIGVRIVNRWLER